MSDNSTVYQVLYMIAPNGNTKDGKTYHVRADHDGEISLDDMLPQLAEDTGLDAEQIQDLVNKLKAAITDGLASGKVVVLDGLVEFRNGFEGSSESPNIVLPCPDIRLVTNVLADEELTQAIPLCQDSCRPSLINSCEGHSRKSEQTTP